MALQVQLYRPAPRTTIGSVMQNSSSQAPCYTQQSMVCVTGDYNQAMKRKERGLSVQWRVKASLDTAAAAAAAAAASGEVAAVVGQVTEVNKDTFWPIVKAAGDKTVVLDMYTQWCGPCKVIAPKFQELSKEYLDVVFLKLDCNNDNKPLAKELGIKVVPTFKILKDSKIVKEVTGAKFDDIVVAINNARSR
ncbi:thioredoxin F-type, chloroplastic-like [Olea europaea var. sylvestris]|uniref:thioredoxin F-type, chloroplastic-like n=1 Tax=Olea europaea var. sylvestris TaxID=158386 RepID=UPI000C1D6002|nr:thioredoxin F-type, chloroplastic-like [Olea europaea var. sylvestris]